MSFLKTLATMFDRVTTQMDEHTIAWSLKDHADCVESSHESLQRLEDLKAKGAELNLNEAYNKGFAIKTTN